MKTKAIDQKDAIAFSQALVKLGLSDAEFAVEDLDNLNDDEKPLALKDIPKQVPLAVRKQLVFLSQQRHKARREMERVIKALIDVGDRVTDKLDDQWRESQAKCESCGQILPEKKK